MVKGDTKNVRSAGNSTMSWAITGAILPPQGKETPEYKGRIVIKWSGKFNEKIPNQVIPGVLTTIYMDGKVLPFAHATVHVGWGALITADVAVYLDDHGEIIYDLHKIAELEAVPAAFTFLVSGMDV